MEGVGEAYVGESTHLKFPLNQISFESSDGCIPDSWQSLLIRFIW